LFFIARIYTEAEAENSSANIDNKRRRDANLSKKISKHKKQLTMVQRVMYRLQDESLEKIR
jgi:hypothetical protein